MARDVLEERTAAVTGGTRGIGAAIVRGLSAAGASVVVGARRDFAQAAERERRVRFVAMDVRDRRGHEALVSAAMDWTGRLDIYVNAAGISQWRALPEVDAAFWDLVLDTNLKGTFLGCQAAAERLGNGGVILNISSLAGKRGSTHNSVYCASKFGVNGLTQALAKELGPRGIRVNAVCPVYVETEAIVESLAATHPEARVEGAAAYLRRFTAQQTALGRLPDADEVAAVCVFLASPAASGITGQCVVVDCGVFPQ